MRVVAIIFVFCFVLSAIVQYNDPDPIIWIALYAVGAIVSALFLKGSLPAYVYLILGIAFLTGAILQRPAEFEGFLFGEVQKMRNMNIELARESFGLGIIAVAMFLFWGAAKRAGK